MIYEELQRLEKLVVLVTAKIQQLEQENFSLKEELFKWKNQAEEKTLAFEDFKNQIKITKLVDSISDEHIDYAELRERINHYIEEIDNIIAYLSE
jgi:mannosyltransferase OCH1-like enzyme